MKSLVQCGFCLSGTCREEDVYYNSIYYALRKHDKALRIRRITDLDTEKEISLKSMPSEGGFQWCFYSMISEILRYCGIRYLWGVRFLPKV